LLSVVWEKYLLVICFKLESSGVSRRYFKSTV
jgi:hypothetical protein